MISWIALSTGTFAAGAGMSFLGSRQRRHATEQEFLAQLTGLLEVDRGMAESLRLVLGELVTAFDCEEAILAFRDTDLERIFVWRLRAGDNSRLTPENLPVNRSDGFLLDQPDASVCWNQLEGAGDGFRVESKGWPPPEGIAAPAGPHAAGAGLAIGAGRHAGPGRASRLAASCWGTGDADFSRRICIGWSESSVILGSPCRTCSCCAISVRTPSKGSAAASPAKSMMAFCRPCSAWISSWTFYGARCPPTRSRRSAGSPRCNKRCGMRLMSCAAWLPICGPLRVQSADLVDLMRGFAERFRNESEPGAGFAHRRRRIADPGPHLP